MNARMSKSCTMSCTVMQCHGMSRNVMRGHMSSVFLVVRGLYTTCTPTRRPTQAYAACEGCLREHKSASRCLCRCRRGQMLSTSTSVEVLCGSSSWKIATLQYKCSFGSSGSKIRNAVQVRIPHLSKDLAARKGLRTQNALKAYANPTRSLRKDCRTNRRKAKEANSFIRGKQS